MRWASELSFTEGSRHWQDQVGQLQRQLDFSTNMCQTLLQEQQVSSLNTDPINLISVWLKGTTKGDIQTNVSKCKIQFLLLPQTLSYMLQTLLTGQYSVLPNNLSSPQVHLVMQQLNHCYTQLAWQQNNIQR